MIPKLKSHPITKWLNKNGWSYHKHQIVTLEETTKGYDILLVAPTGGGKTLAGFMPAITDLIEKKSIQKELFLDDDYRTQNQDNNQRIFYPLNEKTLFKINQKFKCN